MTTNCIAETIEGIVAKANDRGVVLAGRDGWLNVSKFAGGVALPAAGAKVAVALDKGGFIRGVEIIEGGDATESVTRTEPADKDRRITRLATINSAIALLNNRGPATVEQVLDVASQFEAWVTR